MQVIKQPGFTQRLHKIFISIAIHVSYKLAV